MQRGAYVSIAGVTIGLLTLAGCGGGFFQGERAAWRHDAEVACMKSGSVKLVEDLGRGEEELRDPRLGE